MVGHLDCPIPPEDVCCWWIVLPCPGLPSGQSSGPNCASRKTLVGWFLGPKSINNNTGRCSHRTDKWATKNTKKQAFQAFELKSALDRKELLASLAFKSFDRMELSDPKRHCHLSLDRQLNCNTTSVRQSLLLFHSEGIPAPPDCYDRCATTFNSPSTQIPGVAEEKTILTNKVRRINLSTLALGASTVAEFMNPPPGLSPGNNSNWTDTRTHLNHEEEEDELYRNGRVATKIDCGSQLGSALASHDDDRGGQGTSRHPAKNYCVITNRNEEVPLYNSMACLCFLLLHPWVHR